MISIPSEIASMILKTDGFNQSSLAEAAGISESFRTESQKLLFEKPSVKGNQKVEQFILALELLSTGKSGLEVKQLIIRDYVENGRSKERGMKGLFVLLDKLDEIELFDCSIVLQSLSRNLSAVSLFGTTTLLSDDSPSTPFTALTYIRIAELIVPDLPTISSLFEPENFPALTTLDLAMNDVVRIGNPIDGEAGPMILLGSLSPQILDLNITNLDSISSVDLASFDKLESLQIGFNVGKKKLPLLLKKLPPSLAQLRLLNPSVMPDITRAVPSMDSDALQCIWLPKMMETNLGLSKLKGLLASAEIDVAFLEESVSFWDWLEELQNLEGVDEVDNVEE